MLEITAIISLISIYYLTKKYFKHRYTFWERQGVGGHEGLDPTIMSPGFVHEQDIKKYEDYGHVFGYYEFFRPGLVINDTELIREVFCTKFDSFRDSRHMYFGDDCIDLNLFNLPGDDRWKHIRSLCSRAFTTSKLTAIMPSIEAIADQFVDQLSQNFTADSTKTNVSVELDVKKLVSAFLTDTINTFAFSIKSNALKDPDQPIVKMGRKVFAVEAKWPLIISMLLPKVAKFLRLEPFPADAIKYFRDLTHALIIERHNEMLTQKTKRTDFLQIMIDANRDSDGDTVTTKDDDKNKEFFETTGGNQPKPPVAGLPLTTAEMTAQVILFFIAGFDTTSSALSHTLYYLAKHQDIQDKLYEELRLVTDYSHTKLAGLSYLNAVINESLRLSPSILRVERVAKRDVTLKNILIPAGTICTVTPYSLHRDCQYWADDADEFNPDRFMGGPVKDPYALLPFGAGPRQCLGMRFALIQMRLCLTKLVQHYRFNLSPNTMLDYIVGNAFLSPKQVVLSLQKRQ